MLKSWVEQATKSITRLTRRDGSGVCYRCKRKKKSRTTLQLEIRDTAAALQYESMHVTFPSLRGKHPRWGASVAILPQHQLVLNTRNLLSACALPRRKSFKLDRNLVGLCGGVLEPRRCEQPLLDHGTRRCLHARVSPLKLRPAMFSESRPLLKPNFKSELLIFSCRFRRIG